LLVDEPISRRGGTWLVLLLALAIVGVLGAAVLSVGRPAAALFAQAGTQSAVSTERTGCSGCAGRVAPPASGAPAQAARSAPARVRDTSDAVIVRSVATGARAAATPPAAAARPVAAAPVAADARCGGAVSSLLRTLLSPIADVCIGL
jgi:hypothetical protein